MELHYKQYGEEGTPLIILHGLLGASGNWHTLSRNVFSKQFRVFALDQRNHGESPHHERLDYPAMAEDLREFMDQHGLHTAHVMGHSMGGKTAMRFALDHPDRVERLIVVDMAPKAYRPHHLTLIDAMLEMHPERYDSRSEIDEVLAARVKSWPIRQFLLKNLTYDTEKGLYYWKNNLKAVRENYQHIISGLSLDGQFRRPTLFVRGERSGYVQSEDVAQIWRGFPNAQVVTIERANHWVHADAPQPFASSVMDFLTKPEEEAMGR